MARSWRDYSNRVSIWRSILRADDANIECKKKEKLNDFRTAFGELFEFAFHHNARGRIGGFGQDFDSVAMIDGAAGSFINATAAVDAENFDMLDFLGL